VVSEPQHETDGAYDTTGLLIKIWILLTDALTCRPRAPG